jgi:hypothetical protein
MNSLTAKPGPNKGSGASNHRPRATGTLLYNPLTGKYGATSDGKRFDDRLLRWRQEPPHENCPCDACHQVRNFNRLEAERVDRRQGKLLGAESDRERCNVPECAKSTIIVLRDTTETNDRVAIQPGCETIGCPACRPIIVAHWNRLARFFFTLRQRGGPEQIMRIARVTDDRWPTVRRRIERATRKDHLYGYVTFRPAGARHQIVFTSARGVLDRESEFVEVTGAAAVSKFTAMSKAYVGDELPFKSSHGWKLPDRSRDKPHGVFAKTPGGSWRKCHLANDKEAAKLWLSKNREALREELGADVKLKIKPISRFKLVGKQNRTLTPENIAQVAESLGILIKDVSHEFRCGAEEHLKAARRDRMNACGGHRLVSAWDEFLLHAIEPPGDYRWGDDPSRLASNEIPDSEQWLHEDLKITLVPPKRHRHGPAPPPSADLDLATIDQRRFSANDVA